MKDQGFKGFEGLWGKFIIAPSLVSPSLPFALLALTGHYGPFIAFCFKFS